MVCSALPVGVKVYDHLPVSYTWSSTTQNSTVSRATLTGPTWLMNRPTSAAMASRPWTITPRSLRRAPRGSYTWDSAAASLLAKAVI